MTRKKAAFVVRRNLYYKFFGMIVERFLRDGVEVHLLHFGAAGQFQPGNQKSLYFPFLNQTPPFSKPTHLAIIRDDRALSEYLTRHGIQNLYSLESRSHYTDLPESTILHALQHGIDSFKERDFDADFFYVYADGWLEGSGFNPRRIGKIVDAGIFYLDDAGAYDRESIREKYGLPSGRFVLYTPLPSSHGTSYPFLGGPLLSRIRMKSLVHDELRMLAELKDLLEPLGYALLIKSRLKRVLPPEYSKYGIVFYDECFWPSSVAELLSVSDLLLCNFMPSAICTEAVALGKRYVVVPNPAFRDSVIRHTGAYIQDLFLPNGERDLLGRDQLGLVPELAQLGAQHADPLARPSSYIDRFVSRLDAQKKMDAFSAHLA